MAVAGETKFMPCAAPNASSARADQKTGLKYAIVALVTGGLACVIWSNASLCAVLTNMIRPNAAAGAVCGALALIAKVGTRHRAIEHLLVFLCSAALIVLGGSGLSRHLAAPQPIPDGFLASSACLDCAGIAPATAVLLMATGLVLILGRSDASGKLQTVAVGLSLAIIVACGGFGIESIYHLLDPRPHLATSQVSPVTALLFLLINIGALYAHCAHSFMAEFLGPQEGSASARNILMVSTFELVAVGAVSARMQHIGLITTAQSSAALIGAGFVLFAATACNRAARVNALYRQQQGTLQRLKEALLQRTDLSDHLASEQRRLESILRAAELYAIIECNPEGQVLTFNKGAETMLGYKAAEVLGCAPEKWHVADEIAERARSLGVPPGFGVFTMLPRKGLCDNRQWTFVRKDNSRLPVMLSVTSVYDHAGNFTGYVGIARNISADLRAQRDIAGFLGVGQELLCRINRHGVIERVSPSFRRILGYDDKDVVDKPYLNFIHPQDLPVSRNAFAAIGDRMAVERFESRWRDKDGHYRWISWALAHLGDSIYAGGWDVTRDKHRDRERERQLEFEKQLIGIVSHDLRSPLSVIRMNAELMLNWSGPSTKIDACARRVVNATDQAEELIRDLLDFTRARLGGGIPVHLSTVNPVELVRRVVAESGDEHPESHVVVQASRDNQSIKADKNRLHQAVVNLLENSLKHGRGTVTVRVHHSTNECVFEVHNGGPSIDARLLPHVFEPLRHSGTTTAPHEQNFGLGLYIVHEIARAHGGNVSVDSSPERGTTFRIMLPQSGQDRSIHPAALPA